MEYYFQRYGDLELHRRMISDRPRTEAFARAIEELVEEGDVVLDVGTGTGILAMIAARAGAKRVYAIDQAEIVQIAANLSKSNGLGKKIRTFKGPAADLVLPESVDLIVSEWLGNLALVEGMLDDVLAVRDAHLRDGGRMIPGRVDVHLAPLDDNVLYCRDGPGYWREPVAGFDFSELERLELGQGRGTQLRVDPASMLAPGKPILSLDLRTASASDPWRSGTVTFEARRDGVLNGFAGWFVAQLSPGVPLDTGPHEQETHWSQSYLAFPPKLVRAGSRIIVHYDLHRDPEERRHVRLNLKVGRVEQRYLLE